MVSARLYDLCMLIRPAQPGDALAVARVHVRSSQAAYRGLFPAEYLDQLRVDDRAARYDFSHSDPEKPFTQLAEIDSRIVGLVITAPARDADCAGLGELLALYVAPEQWRQGIGRELAVAARKKLAEMGFVEAVLWMLDGNARADHFYRNDAWLPDGSRKHDTIGGITLPEVRYRRTLP